jgi:plasmid stabilization system protein ParE
VKIVVTARAGRSIDDADTWWRANRDDADLLAVEFEEAVKMLAHAPHIGRRVMDTGLKGVRVIALQKTEKLLYYRVLDEEDVVELLELWGARRGTRPHLRASRSQRKGRT